MIVSFTGHRPKDMPKEYGYSLSSKRWQDLCKCIQATLLSLQATKTITGGALGCDSIAFIASYLLKIDTELAIPCEGQDKLWNDKDKEFYAKMKQKATNVTLVNKEYSATNMQLRNEYMIDNSDVLIAIWTGKRYGGTFNAIQYAIRKNKRIIWIDPTQKKLIAIPFSYKPIDK